MACRLLLPLAWQTLRLWLEPDPQFFPVSRCADEREGLCQDSLPVDKPFPERSPPGPHHADQFQQSNDHRKGSLPLVV